MEKSEVARENERIMREEAEKWREKKLLEVWESAHPQSQSGEVLRVDYYSLALKLSEIQPFFYSKDGFFWVWDYDERQWKRFNNDIEMLNFYNQFTRLHSQSLDSFTRTKILNSLKQVGVSKAPMEAPKEWILFNGKVVDYRTGDTFPAYSDYFFVNSIPHNYNENDPSEDTPVMDKLFTDWVGAENVRKLWEIMAYCCIRDYPIHNIFCFYGRGMNGKSQFLQVLENFVGTENKVATDLQALCDHRFEKARLKNKLVAFVGETDNELKGSTTVLKRMSSGDALSCEQKGKDATDFVNYAKLCVATNNLPAAKDDSDGYARRWVITEFPNSFEGKLVLNVVDTIPPQEYDHATRKVMRILPTLLENKGFSGVGTIEDQKKAYMRVSNPLPLFLETCCEVGDAFDHYVQSSKLHSEFVRYLKSTGARFIGRQEFHKALDALGFERDKCNLTIPRKVDVWTTSDVVGENRINTNWVFGLKLKGEIVPVQSKNL